MTAHDGDGAPDAPNATGDGGGATGEDYRAAWEKLRARLARSPFRSRFRLGPKEWAVIDAKGRDGVRAHVRDLLARRLAPAEPPNDGRQTPMRGHPCFVAQHATACCCRGCLEKWHGIAAHAPLTAAQLDYLVAVIDFWLDGQVRPAAAPGAAPRPRAANRPRAKKRPAPDDGPGLF